MNPSEHRWDAIVLGAGAAGLMCAIEGGRRGRRVLVLDHAERIGKKILISGGGRCNFTNIHCRAENFLSQNPHFAKSALARFTPADIIAMVERHSIPWHEKTLGQLFCNRTAQDVVAMLSRECAAANVSIRCSVVVDRVQRDDGFILTTSAGELHTTSLVVATGGLSIPKLGATAFGYELATQFGIKIVECRPALVPFVLSPEDRDRWCDLSGLSAEVVARTGKQLFREKMLVTHKGLSGPAVLQISSYWKPGEPVEFDLAPDQDLLQPLFEKNARRDAGNAIWALRAALPTRLAERWLAVHPPRDWTNHGLAEMERALHTWRVIPAGTEGYAKAEVTAGGVDTAELDARTMQSRRIPDLYFIGEVVDVTGWLGGYNFQWAWASGASAGQAL